MDIDISKFKDIKQQANVCVLFSYWRFIQYFNPSVKFHPFCISYIQYMQDKYNIISHEKLDSYICQELDVQRRNPDHKNENLNEKCSLLLNSDSDIANELEHLNDISIEVLTYAVLHYYCQKDAGDIRGLDHLTTLHKTFITQDSQYVIPNTQINFTQDSGEIVQAIDNIQKGNIDFLILLYQTQRQHQGQIQYLGHTIMLVNTKNGIYIGDPNLKRFKKIAEYEKLDSYSNKFDINRKETITECITIKCNAEFHSGSI